MRRRKMITFQEITDEVLAKREPRGTPPVGLGERYVRDPLVVQEIVKKVAKAQQKGLLIEPQDPKSPL